MSGEDAAETWYVRTRGRVLGPLSGAQLRALRDRGQLARFDQVSRDRQDWMAADRLEHLFPPGDSGGAFVAGPRPKTEGPSRGPEPASNVFLILDEEDEPRPRPAVDRGPAASAAADDSDGWHYAEAGAPQGPVGFAELRRLARDGRIGPATLYWRAGLDQWTSGADLTELDRLWPSGGGRSGGTGPAPAPPRGPSAGPGAVTPAAPVAPMAMISLLSNLLCLVGNLAAVIVGVLALRQIARSGGALSGKRHAIAGIAMGTLGLVASALTYFLLIAQSAHP